MLIIFIYCLLSIDIFGIYIKKNKLKVALCTMGKKENLYAREYMAYYMRLGVDHMFIYDNNDIFTEKIEDVLDKKYKKKITFFETRLLNITYQKEAYNHCYKNNFKTFDWFIMIDMDEYLYIINDTLKDYLGNKVFDKCDFIKIHWAETLDNNLLYYDPRPLFQRFKKPYLKKRFIKSTVIIRGHISNLEYWVHSPFISPDKNVTCTNEGKIIKYKNMNFESIKNINTNKAYFVHFTFKSTEEFINKYKRGYSNWHGIHGNQVLLQRIATYFHENGATLEKINYLEKELKLNLSVFRTLIYYNKSFNLFRKDLMIY